MNKKNPHAVALGRLGGKIGGKASGPRKARTSEQARAAVLARWAKVRKEAEQAPRGRTLIEVFTSESRENENIRTH